MRILLAASMLLFSTAAVAEEKEPDFELLIEACRKAHKLEPTPENVAELIEVSTNETLLKLHSEAFVGRREMEWDKLGLTGEAREQAILVCWVYTEGVVDNAKFSRALIKNLGDKSPVAAGPLRQ